jgi:hypothetical protein
MWKYTAWGGRGDIGVVVVVVVHCGGGDIVVA